MDPTREELVEVCADYYENNGDDSDIFSQEAAIYWFCSDYHSGQTSNLYSVLSTSKFKPSCLHKDIYDEDNLIAEIMYETLEVEFT